MRKLSKKVARKGLKVARSFRDSRSKKGFFESVKSKFPHGLYIPPMYEEMVEDILEIQRRNMFRFGGISILIFVQVGHVMCLKSRLSRVNNHLYLLRVHTHCGTHVDTSATTKCVSAKLINHVRPMTLCQV